MPVSWRDRTLPELESRWMIRDGDEVEQLSEIEVDVDTSYEELPTSTPAT